MRVMISRSNIFMIFGRLWKIFNIHIDSCLMSDDGSCAAAAGNREEMEPAGGAVVDLPASEVNNLDLPQKEKLRRKQKY